MLLLAMVSSVPSVLRAQLTTGFVAGTLRAPDGYPVSGAAILVRGDVVFRQVIHTSPNGEFGLALPYGWYQFSVNDRPDQRSSIEPIFIAALKTTRLDLSVDSSGVLHRRAQTIRMIPSQWADDTGGRIYPEGFSLQGALLSREPASVTEPLNFIGLADNRLVLESQRGFSWTATQYKLQGMDATDSYQPGRPAILPDMQAVQEVVVRSAFAQTTSSAYGTEAGLFLDQPGASWHGTLASADTGSFLASTNLPPPSHRGPVQQADRFRWFTRDRLQIGGPLAKWADFLASGAGQWASQTAPLATSGSEQRSRMLYGNARGRIRAGVLDQFDALYSGSRVDLSDWAMPAGLEALTGRRMAPQFVLPYGVPGQAETDHLDFLQVGWTHHLPAVSNLGILEVRYGYATTHLNTRPSGEAVPNQSRIELLGGGITGAPPIENLAVRPRHEIEGTWQTGVLWTAPASHRVTVGAGGKTATPRNRFTTPSGINLITANGAPAAVVEFNTPLNTRELLRSFSGYVLDQVTLTPTLSLDLGGLADFSRGSLPAQSSPAGTFTPTRKFPAQSDLISWNSISPRVGLAWQPPHSRGLVLRGAYLRLYTPLAGRYLDFGNPNSLGGSEYQWLDRNSDDWFQPGEQGALLNHFGGPYSSISTPLHRPHSDEFDIGADMALPQRTVVGIHLFRRDEKERIATIDTGVPSQAFASRSILDPGPDGIPGTFDDRQLIVYEQSPASFGQDRYLLTNPPGLRMLNTGLLAELRTEFHGVTLHASFVAEKSYGPTNPGNAAFENDPGIIGALLLDPNSAIHGAGRAFTDRAYVGKMQATYRLPSSLARIELASVAGYTDGLVFARQLLVTGLAQGPFLVATTVRGSPEGGNRAQYAVNWNLRLRRQFTLPIGRIVASVDVLNVTNAGQSIQENSLSGASFNLRLPVAIQPARFVRIEFRYEF
jgi:hypothetical protein